MSHLHEFAEILMTSSSEFKLVVSVDQGYVYTNDLGLLDVLDNLPFLNYKSFSQAKVDRPRDTICLKRSNHQFRGYFRTINLSADEKNHLCRFLASQGNNVRLSPALQQWVAQPFNRTQDYYFVDYDSATWLTMLALVRPGLIRKTMQIIQAK